MAEIIVVSKSDLEALIHNSVIKALDSQGLNKEETKDKIFNLSEAAAFLKLAPQTIYGFTSKRKIPFIKKGKKLYFKQCDLEAWLEAGRKKSSAQIEDELQSQV